MNDVIERPATAEINYRARLAEIESDFASPDSLRRASERIRIEEDERRRRMMLRPGPPQPPRSAKEQAQFNAEMPAYRARAKVLMQQHEADRAPTSSPAEVTASCRMKKKRSSKLPSRNTALDKDRWKKRAQEAEAAIKSAGINKSKQYNATRTNRNSTTQQAWIAVIRQTRLEDKMSNMQALTKRAGDSARAKIASGEITKDKFEEEYYRVIREGLEAERAAEESAEEEESEPAPTNVVPVDIVSERRRTRDQQKQTSQVKPKPEPVKITDEDANHIKIGSALIAVVRGRNEDIMFTEKAAYRYNDGLWRMAGEVNAWLNIEIEKAIRALNYDSAIRLVNETRAWILRQDALYREHDDIPWDQHGLVPTESGLVNPRTGEVRPFRRDDYATWKVPCKYDPNAECPDWLQMLGDTFSDRDGKEKDDVILVIQESLGAGLLDNKPKALSRALIFQGGSNSGKSSMIEVLSALFGEGVNTADFASLEGTHGMMPFLKRRPWVLHEAFDQKSWHFSSKVKAIISNEPVQVNIKNGAMLSMRITSPIFWGSNHGPQFKESTKAIVNRLLIIKCNREFLQEQHVGVGLKARRRGLNKPSDLVIEDEMPGVLAWAVQGAKTALARGYFNLPDSMTDELAEVFKGGNMVAGFMEECITYDPTQRLSIPDFCLAFSQWWLENKAENRGVPTNENIGKAVAALSDPCIAIDRKELRDMTRRYYGGIILNAAGLNFHEAGLGNNNLSGRIASTTEYGKPVNQRMTSEWLEKPCIQKMIKAHDERSSDRSKTKF